MFRKLSERDVTTIHRLHRDGLSNSAIAELFNVHRNTISNHLAMRVSCPPSVYAKIGAERRVELSASMSIYDAAAYLPGWPSRAVVYRLAACGVLKSRLVGQAGSHKNPRRLVATRSAIRSAARKMLPKRGLWFRADRLSHYCSPFDARLLVGDLEGSGVRLKYWPSVYYYSAIEVMQAAEQRGIELSIGFPVRRRASLSLELSDVATI